MTNRTIVQSMSVLVVMCLTAPQPRAQADMTVSNSTLTVSGSGVVNLCGRTMQFTPTAQLSETGGGRITGGRLTTTRPLVNPTLLNVAGFGLTISSWANLGQTTVIRGHTGQLVNGNPGILRYFQVTPTNNSGLNADLVFRYHQAELNGIPESDLRLYYSTNGSTWTQRAGSLDVVANTFKVSGLSSFSYWTAASKGTDIQHFVDVPPSSPYFSFVEKIFAVSITAGCASSLFCPAATVTRAQMAIFLLKAKHGSSYTPPAATGIFSDVPPGYWARAWIEQLANEGITSGCGPGLYCPENVVTRAQMAVFLLKTKYGSAYSPAPYNPPVFLDVPVGHWARAFVEQLAAQGITAGCGPGIYCPDNPVTREQMAVFLTKAFGY